MNYRKCVARFARYKIYFNSKTFFPKNDVARFARSLHFTFSIVARFAHKKRIPSNKTRSQNCSLRSLWIFTFWISEVSAVVCQVKAAAPVVRCCAVAELSIATACPLLNSALFVIAPVWLVSVSTASEQQQSIFRAALISPKAKAHFCHASAIPKAAFPSYFDG